MELTLLLHGASMAMMKMAGVIDSESRVIADRHVEGKQREMYRLMGVGLYNADLGMVYSSKEAKG